MRQNVRYCNITELLLAKEREHEEALKAKMNQSIENLAWIITLGVVFTGLALLAAYQEGLLP